MEGDPKYPGSQWLPDFEYAKYGELLRPRRGSAATTADDMRAAWEEALAADRPVVLEVDHRPGGAAAAAAHHAASRRRR